jgi:hypothetical protein
MRVFVSFKQSKKFFHFYISFYNSFSMKFLKSVFCQLINYNRQCDLWNPENTRTKDLTKVFRTKLRIERQSVAQSNPNLVTYEGINVKINWSRCMYLCTYLSKATSQLSTEEETKIIFQEFLTTLVGLQGWTLSHRGLFTPSFNRRGEHSLVFRRIKGITESLHPWWKLYPWGPTSTLVVKFRPWEWSWKMSSARPSVHTDNWIWIP